MPNQMDEARTVRATAWLARNPYHLFLHDKITAHATNKLNIPRGGKLCHQSAAKTYDIAVLSLDLSQECVCEGGGGGHAGAAWPNGHADCTIG